MHCPSHKTISISRRFETPDFPGCFSQFYNALSPLLLCNSGVFPLEWLCLSWRLWTIQLPSQWHLVLGGMDQKWGPAFCGDNRVSPRAPGTEWRIGVKGPLLRLPCGCQPPDLVWVQQPLGTQTSSILRSGFIPLASVSEPPQPGVTLSLFCFRGFGSHFLHCIQVGKGV